jgi:hypothetical protein
MCKIKIQYILFTIVVCLLSSTVYAGDNEKIILSRFLSPKGMAERQKAFDDIIANEKKYRDTVLDELQKFIKKPNKTPDGLIYLAAFLKDKRYIRPLATLINNADYSERHCIYSCPIVFSLVIFDSFTDYSLPPLDDNLTAVHDLRSEVERVKHISIEPEEASKYIVGPGVDESLKRMEALPLADVIKLAGAKTKDANERLIAAIVLQAHVTNDKYLKGLYWLAITDVPNDASAEYRAAIYWAIYRAETYRKKKST